MADEATVLTIAEAAAVLRISTQLAYQMARDGRIPAIKLGRRVVISRAKLMALIEGGSTQKAA